MTRISIGSNRALLLVGAAAVSLMLPAAAQAQNGQAEEEAKAAAAPADDTATQVGNEIIVTAAKREQTLQDVPIAVTVTTADTIERAQIRDLRDLASVVPSLRVNQSQSSANTSFFIRGFGNGANNAGIEPSVGMFVDGVYRSRAASMIADMPDIQRVEVLRGPQSTLFGKNASAGVISLVTKAPKFELGGNLEASYGNDNAVVVKGVVTGPLSETVAASLAGGYNRRDGYVTDLGTGNKTNERNRWFLRGQILFQPSSDLKVRLIADYGKIDETCCAVVNLRRSPASGAILALGGRLSDPATPFADEVYNNFDSTNKIDNWGLSGQIDYNAGPLKFTSITAYRNTKALTNQDSDFSSADLLGRNSQNLNIDTFTQELRVNTDWDGPFNLLIGAFYFNEKIDQSNRLLWGSAARPYANILVMGASGCALSIFSPSTCPTPGGPTPTSLEATFGGLEAAAAGNPALAGKYLNQFFAAGQGLTESYKLKDESYSIFGQADFKVSDRLTLTLGSNYTHDSKVFSTNTSTSDVFASVNLDDPRYAPFRQQLLYLGGLAQQVGVALNLGRSATAAEIGTFASNPTTNATFNAINTAVLANAVANQNNPAANPLNGLKALQVLPPFMNIPNAVESGKISAGHWSWTARLAYEFSDQLNGYVSFATGYKAASVNLSRDSRPTPDDLVTLKARGLAVTNLSSGSRFAGPEEATVFEAGIKGHWGATTANVAVFKQSIKGFQSNIFTGTGFFLANAGKQSAFGVEFEGTVKPVPELTLSFAMTYLEPKYDQFILSAFGDLSGSRPGGVTAFSSTLGAQWNHELASGERVILNASWHHEDSFKLVEGLPGLVVKNAAGQVTSVVAALQAAQDFKQKIDQVNGSITYVMNSGIELTVWARNLLDKRTIMQIFDSPIQIGSISGYPSEPRTFGASVRYRF